MPVPKKRLGKSDKRHRRANWRATVPTITTCTHCGAACLPHTMCAACGTYKGIVVDSSLHQHHAH